MEKVISHRVNISNDGMNFRQRLAVIVARECVCADRGAEHDDSAWKDDKFLLF